MKSNPSKLTQGSLSQSLTLTVENDEFIFDNATRDKFIFDGDLAALIVNSVSISGGDTQKIVLSFSGTIVKDTGQGTLTIKGGFLKGGKDITVSISVE